MAAFGAAGQEEEDMTEHTELLVHIIKIHHRPRSTSTPRHVPQVAGGAKDAEDSVRSATVAGVGLGSSTHVMNIASPVPPILRAKLVAKAREDHRCEQ